MFHMGSSIGEEGEFQSFVLHLRGQNSIHIADVTIGLCDGL